MVVGTMLVLLIVSLALLIIIAGYSFVVLIRRYQKFNKADIDDLNRLNDQEFVLYVAGLYNKKGYKVTNVGGPGDFGADLVIEKDSVRKVVQIKKWNVDVDNRAIQQVLGSIPIYKASSGIVVTDRYFKRAAKILAKANNVELIDRVRLSDMILETKEMHGE